MVASAGSTPRYGSKYLFFAVLYGRKRWLYAELFVWRRAELAESPAHSLGRPAECSYVIAFVHG